MNDFTKEELTILFLELNIAIRHWGEAKEYKNYPVLRDKLQSMINNYCEHEPDGNSYCPGLYKKLTSGLNLSSTDLLRFKKCIKCEEFYNE